MLNWSLKIRCPAIIVSAKLIPVATGTVKEKGADDKALNIINADAKISIKAIMTCPVIRKPIQSLKLFKTIPFNLNFIIAAPDTLKIEYRKQYKIDFIMFHLILLFHQL